jgi:hypothetical protein
MLLMDMPQYLADLYKYVESVPYGTVDIRVVRQRRNTKSLQTTAEETLRYVNNAEAIKDLLQFAKQLTDTGFSGEAHVKLTLDKGQIKLLSIFDKKETPYEEAKQNS